MRTEREREGGEMREWGYYITTTSDEASLQWRGGDGWLGGISDEQSMYKFEINP